MTDTYVDRNNGRVTGAILFIFKHLMRAVGRPGNARPDTVDDFSMSVCLKENVLAFGSRSPLTSFEV